MPRQKPINYFLIIASAALYALLAYGVDRDETTVLLTVYALLFAIYAWTIRQAQQEDLGFWICSALIFRLVFFLAIPALSDDFYRFIWDGRLWAAGYHPFKELPGYYLQTSTEIPGINPSLYDHLNSKGYFTIYPPLAQAIFWIAVALFPNSILGSVVVMRLFILAAEVASIMLLKKLLAHFGLDTKNVLLYALNPLVILELTGNLHFEALVVCFLLLAIYLACRSKWVRAGMSFGLAVCAKLVPLIFLPLFLVRLGLRKSLVFYAAVLLTCLLLFAPLLNKEVFYGMSQSLGLYFKRFEFNASIYYLVREYGYWTKGYNIIQTTGWKLGVASGLIILLVSWWPFRLSPSDRGKRLILSSWHFPHYLGNVPALMMWIWGIYLLFSTTIHPWYVIPMLMLSVFTAFRFVVVWSALAFFTYAGYSATEFHENMLIVLMEYGTVLGYLIYELIWKRKSLLPS